MIPHYNSCYFKIYIIHLPTIFNLKKTFVGINSVVNDNYYVSYYVIFK